MASQGRGEAAEDRPPSHQPYRYHSIDLWTTAGRWPLAITSGRLEAATPCSYPSYSAHLTWKNKAISIKKVQVNFFQQSEMDLSRFGFPAAAMPTSFHTHNPLSSGSQDAPGLPALAGPGVGCSWLWRCAGGTGLPRDKKKRCGFVLASKGREQGSSPWHQLSLIWLPVSPQGDTATFTPGGCTKVGGKRVALGGG